MVNNLGGFYRVLEWVMWIIYLNLLWIAFSVVGLGVFGIFPASVAMFTVIRNLLQESGESIIKTFFHTFKREFFKANALGIILVAIGYILYIDFLFLDRIQGILFNVLQFGLLLAGLIYLLTLIYIIPVYVHFDLKFFQSLKQAMLIGIFSPFMNVVMVLGFLALYYIFRFIPGLIPLVAIPTIAGLIMRCVLIAFQRIENRQKRLNKPKVTDS